jgi:hypothetical protein
MELLKRLRTIIITILVINGIVVLWVVIKVPGGRGPIPMVALNAVALLLGIGALAQLNRAMKAMSNKR